MTKQICYHIEMFFRGTYADPTPMKFCRCGKTAICPICGWGWGSYPCDCDGFTIYEDLDEWR